MKRIALTAAFFLVASGACHALDLTPHRRIAGVQDATFRYFFQDGPKKIAFRLDPKASVDGTPTRATFDFTDLGTAGMTIAISPLGPDTAFDAEGLKQYQKLATESLPAGCAGVKLESELPNTIAINGWTSHQYVFTCNFYGVSLRKSVTILNFNKKEQLIVSISAPPKDFQKTYARSYGILNSIYEMKPDEDKQDPGT